MMIHIETEGVNPITVKMLPKEYKIVYTFIKKNKTVEMEKLKRRFRRFDVETIIKDLELMYLVYF